jgi:hypothetical protein
MENNNNIIKYIVKTDNGKTYSLYIMEADEYKKGRYVSLFLYYDDNNYDETESLWLNLRHRILYESSVEAIKNKVIEYADGRNEKLIFFEVQNIPAVKV